MITWLVKTDDGIDSVWTQESRAVARMTALHQLDSPEARVEPFTCNQVDQPESTDRRERPVVACAAVWLVDVTVQFTQTGRLVSRHHRAGQVEIVPIADLGRGNIQGTHETRVYRVDLQDLDEDQPDDFWQAIVVLSAVSAEHASDLAAEQFRAYRRDQYVPPDAKPA